MSLTTRTTDTKDEVVVEHRWPWTVQEIAIIVFLLALPTALHLLHVSWAYTVMQPISSALGLFLIWLGWSRKRVSTVRLTLNTQSLRVEWPHTKTARRAKPSQVDLDAITGATLPKKDGYPGNEMSLEHGDDKRVLVPFRVLTTDVATRLLEATADADVAADAKEKLRSASAAKDAA